MGGRFVVGFSPTAKTAGPVPERNISINSIFILSAWKRKKNCDTSCEAEGRSILFLLFGCENLSLLEAEARLN